MIPGRKLQKTLNPTFGIKNENPLYIWNAMELSKIEDALIAYRSLSQQVSTIRIPELVGELMRTDIRGFVSNLSDDDIDGKKPMLALYTKPEGQTPVSFRLWWDKGSGRLQADYLD